MEASFELDIIGTITGNYTVFVKEAADPEGAANRYIRTVAPKTIVFSPIADNTTHAYIVKVTSDECSAEHSFELLVPCTGTPTATFNTKCSSYNPTNNRVNLGVSPQLTGATQVKVTISTPTQVYADQLIPTGTETNISVPANINLSIRIVNASYEGCTYTTSYVAACAVPCSFTIDVTTPTCEGGTIAVADLKITDSDPGEYEYKVFDANNQPVLESIVFGNMRWKLSTAGNTYTVRVTKTGCPPITKQVTVGCQTGGCSRLGATEFKLRKDSGSGYTSFADVCAKYCNQQYSEFSAWITGYTLNDTVYSQSSGCSFLSDGYYIVMNSQNQVIVLIRIQNGKIVETQPACNCANPSLSVDINVQNPSCVNGSLTASTVYLTNTVNANKYAVCEGTSFTCANDCNSATAIGQNTSEPIKAKIVGNSILSHGEAPQIGWYWNRGMAASADNKDFYSLTKTRMLQANPANTLDKGDLMGFETSYTTFNFANFRGQFTGYNLAILRFGENLDDSQLTANNFAGKLGEMISNIRQVNPTMKIILSTSFWAKPTYDTIVRNLAQSFNTAQSPVKVMDISYMVYDPQYAAYSQENVAGAIDAVKAHPGDTGMQGISDRLYDTMSSLFSTSSSPLTSFSIPAPTQGTEKKYVIRVWNTLYSCTVYRDYPITVTSPICCVTREVSTNSNSSTTINYTDCNNQAKTDTISGANSKKRYCIKEGSLTVSGAATHNLVSYTCDVSTPCSLDFSKSDSFCEDNVPKVRYLASGGATDNDYQIKVGNENWIDFAQGRVHTLAGQDNTTYNVQIRLKSNNACVKNDNFTFNTNCTNTGTGCNKPTLNSQTLGVPAAGSAYSSNVQACEEACNNRVVYRNYYAVNLNIGSTVYNTNNSSPNDCSTVPDGWYVGLGKLYRIQGGIIVEVGGACFCGEVPTLSPSTFNNVQNDQVYTVNVGYNCTTSGVNIYKNNIFFGYLAAGVHQFTFTGNQVNNGDKFTAKTVCGTTESGPSNEVIIGKDGGTVTPPTEEVCNFPPTAASLGFVVEKFNYNINFNGTVFYMLSTGGIPDQLNVFKNDVLVNSYLATSWRTVGSINVAPGDRLRFEVDGTVSGIGGTGWTFYINCNTPYDVNANYGDQDRNNERPNVQLISPTCTNGKLSFTVNANSATATGSPVVESKLLGYGDNFLQNEQWERTMVLTSTIRNKDIVPNTKYCVYVRAQDGKFFGICNVVHPGASACQSTPNPDPNPQPSCDKSGMNGVDGKRRADTNAFASAGEAQTQYCANNTNAITFYIKGAGNIGDKVYANNGNTDCNSVPNGYYVINNFLIIRVVDGVVTENQPLASCDTGCDKSNSFPYAGYRQINGSAYTNSSDAKLQYCGGNRDAVPIYIQGSGDPGSRVYANANAGDCSSLPDGFYVLLDTANNPWKIVGVVSGAVFTIQDFGGPCYTTPTDPPPTSGNVCTYAATANGGPEIRTLNFRSDINGKVYFWFNPVTVPDKLTVKKNNNMVFDYPTGGGWSARRYDSVNVNVGDTITFIIDGTVSGDSTTIWQFKSNCNKPYNSEGNLIN